MLKDKRNILRYESGFTLIEVVGGLAILSMTIMALMPLMVQASDWANTSEAYMSAGHLVPAIIDDVNSDRNDVTSTLKTKASNDRTVTLSPEDLETLNIFQDYNQRIEVTLSPETDLGGSHSVSVKVLNDKSLEREGAIDVTLATGFTYVDFSEVSAP